MNLPDIFTGDPLAGLKGDSAKVVGEALNQWFAALRAGLPVPQLKLATENLSAAWRADEDDNLCLYVGEPGAIESAQTKVATVDKSTGQLVLEQSLADETTLNADAKKLSTPADVVRRAAQAIAEQVYPTRAELLLRNLPDAATRVRTSGYAAPGDGGGADYAQSAIEPAHPGKFQTPDGRWFKIAEASLSPSHFGGDQNAAAAAAFAESRPLLLRSGIATIDLAFPNTSPEANHEYLMRALSWHSTCDVRGRASLILRIPEGLTRVNAWDALGSGVPVTFIDATGPKVFLQSAGSTIINIASLTYGARTGNVYPLSISAATALPTFVAPGYPIGIRNVTGDNDAGAADGAMVVETISPDRLTITGHLVCPRAADLVSPTTIDTTTVFRSVLPSRLIIPHGALAIDTRYTGGLPDWTGANFEGYFNLNAGGQMDIRHIGLSWLGAAETEHDIIFFSDSATQLTVNVNAVIAGAGDKCLRGYGSARVFVNQACIGGAGVAQEGVTLQAGATSEVARSCIGGFVRSGLSFGDGCKGTVSASMISSAAQNVVLVGPGSSLSLATSKVTSGARGVYRIKGDLALGVGMEYHANAVDLTLVSAEETVTLLNNQLATFPLAGKGGRVEFVCETTPGASFTLDVDIDAATDLSEAVYRASRVVEASGTLTSTPVNPGKVSYSIYKSGSVYYFALLNETLAARKWVFRVLADNFALGTPLVSGAATEVGANILTAPRDFSNAAWASGGAGASVASNASISPDGDTLADRLNDTTTTGAAARRQQAVALTIGTVYEASLCIKKDTSRYAAIEMVSGTRRVVVDLDTGAFLSQNFDMAIVEPAGEGFWRVVVRWLATAGSTDFRVYPAYAGSLTQTVEFASTGAVFVDLAFLAPVL